MTGYSLKLQSKKGQHVVTNLDAGTTIGTLKARISEITQIPQPLLHILVGFPPKPLDLSRDAEILSASGITSGDTLIVEEKNNATLDEDAKLARRLYAEEEESNRIREIENQSNGEFIGILLKKVVPADNSCLFTSIGYVLNGAIDTECGSYMRDIIAEHVASDPDTYNEAMLGKPNAEYCNWIRRPESWGGAIEVSILSSFYGLEIDVVDITNAIINRFGEDKNYGLRVFLLFDGIHYDPLYMESMSDGPPKTIFPIEDEGVYQQAEQLAREAKSSRQFTDVNKFTLRCIQCDALLIGQVEAQQHAISTGHTNFGIHQNNRLISEENLSPTLDDDEKLARSLYEEELEKTQLAELAKQSTVLFSGILLKKAVPADNSCLFTSIGFLLNGTVDTDCGACMRDIIAEKVASDPETYNEAMLAKPNSDYCLWIKRPESWGGAIEISILSNFYGLEIDVVDITNAIINRFGEDKNYGLRGFLVFDGIHYDPLYMEPIIEGPPKTIFPIENDSVYQQAKLMAAEAKLSKQQNHNLLH